jgi:hypothetical protein
MTDKKFVKLCSICHWPLDPSRDKIGFCSSENRCQAPRSLRIKWWFQWWRIWWPLHLRHAYFTTIYLLRLLTPSYRKKLAGWRMPGWLVLKAYMRVLGYRR